MRTYICHKCSDFICETSICPICGERTEIFKNEVFWCDECNVPVYSDKCDSCGSITRRISSDLRPVFPEERLLIEILLDCPMKYSGSSCWSASGGVYWIDGKRIKLSLKEMAKQNTDVIISKLKQYEAENEAYCNNYHESDSVLRFIKANKSYLNILEKEALDFIRLSDQEVNADAKFVSFSGGKDSTVVSSLVMDALSTESIVHIYGDTTLEYPESAKYIERLKKKYPKTPILIAKNREQDFSNMCDVVGPPSRVLRWCCTVFKTGAINRKIESVFAKKQKLLTFQGIRRSESSSRNKYERIAISPKITKQVACQPILDWSDFDVWMYILTKGIDFNAAYRLGFSRVGCWCCPNNTEWAEFLSSIYMKEQYEAFRSLLYGFAQKVGKKDWKEYIDEGKWKARQGGNGLEFSKNAVVEYKPCVLEENTVNFELTRPIDNSLYGLFIPFGRLNYELGNPRLGEVFIVGKDNQPILRFAGKTGQRNLKVTILKLPKRFKNHQELETFIKAQITKFQTCIGCSGCSSICKFSAITVENTKPGAVGRDTIVYKIDPLKCVGCLDCVLHFDSGCYMKKVLRVKIGEDK